MNITHSDSFAFISKNFGAVTKAIHKELVWAWGESVKSFIEAAESALYNSGSKPTISTGMTVATLKGLYDQLKRYNVVITDVPDPVVFATERRKKAKGIYMDDKDIIRDIPAGIEMGQKAYYLSIGTYYYPILQFSFEMQAHQHTVWEKDWQSMNAGMSAFMITFHNLFNTLNIDATIKKWILNTSLGNEPLGQITSDDTPF